ncbi:putative proteasome inhibitor [Pseudocercospora fuligena]|uniref:Putative proteasome inhibitor n=1 Tax=Pseudocercospora fuligena TaxID=685502 RepID=A0A8H6RJ09_9PEZI|nr:putative proteasome inhibitor [Pseudocercospora fuligena]
MADTPPLNALSGQTISRFMLASFPKDATTQLRNAYDAIALAAHASMLAVGFRLVGLGEEHRIEATSNPDEPEPIPSEWNAQSGSYAFRYKHGQSSMEFLVKVTRMGNKANIVGMGLGDDRIHQFELKVDEYVSAGNLPLELSESEGSNEEKARKVVDAFINVGRLSDFGSLMRIKLIQKLAPSLQKEGYEETREGQSSNTREPAPGREDNRPQRDPLRDDRDPQPARPYPLHDPLAQPGRPRAPVPEPIPGFEDEFEIQRPPRGMQPGGFPRYGERDLYPQGLGPNDPLRGGVGPGLGGMGGGGMHPTFDDPLFAGQGQRGPGFDPQAPPGARFDPPFGPGQGGHPRGAGMGGRPPNPFGGFGDGDFI